jgi:hypothetical protein
MTNATHHANENLTIHLKVKDYATWRTGYDAREKSRLSAGMPPGMWLEFGVARSPVT